jgi:HSP20 family protein
VGFELSFLQNLPFLRKSFGAASAGGCCKLMIFPQVWANRKWTPLARSLLLCEQVLLRRLIMALPTRVQRFVDPYESAQREFDGVLGRLFGNRIADGGNYLAPYGVDVREDADHIYVEAELPGYKKEEVDVDLENQTLTITAEHSENHEPKDGDKAEWLLRERRYSRFHRSFTLPPTVSAQSVQANLRDGVLTVTLDKREEAKPRRIPVS